MTRCLQPLSVLVWLVVWIMALYPMCAVNAEGGTYQHDLTDDEKKNKEAVIKGKLKKDEKFLYSWSDLLGDPINADEQKGKADGDGNLTISGIPKEAKNAGGKMVTVDDIIISAPSLSLNAQSNLHIESFQRMGADLLVTPFWYAAWEINGYDIPMVMPGVYGDTNGDGQIGDGDTLYSSVNLYDCPAGYSMPSFEMGAPVYIVNGVSPAFPGMVFGSAPIRTDPTQANGFYNPSPVTLTGTIGAQYSVLVSYNGAPEPTPLALTVVGFVLGTARLFRWQVRHRRHQRTG